MAQNMQTENKAVYLDPFRYNEFEGFNSHNHIVVTEVGDGTSVVEVKLVQESLNPLGMAHGGLIFTLCDVATGVAARTGGRITVTLDSNIQGHGKARRARPRGQGRPHDRPCHGGGVRRYGQAHRNRRYDGLLCGREHIHGHRGTKVSTE